MSATMQFKRQCINEEFAIKTDIYSQECDFHFDSSLLNSSPREARISHDEYGTTKDKLAQSPIFKVEKGRNLKRRKHILNFDQVSILENYFHIDPDWKMKTVGKLSLLSRKKLFIFLYIQTEF